MKGIYVSVLISLLFSYCSREKVKYPETKKVDVVDEYFGVSVPDPYRWLEDYTSEETKDWVQRQNEYTEGYFERIPYVKEIEKSVREKYEFTKRSIPYRSGGGYVFYENDGKRNQEVYYFQKTLEDSARLILDPNELSTGGTVAVSEYAVSSDGKYFAYSLANSGSDWVEIYVKNTETGKQLPDCLKWVKFSLISWYQDGFYYTRYEEPDSNKTLSKQNQYQEIYYHKLGDNQKNDKQIYLNNSPDLMYYADVTDDEKYLALYEKKWGYEGNVLIINNLQGSGSSEFVKLTNDYDYEYYVVGNTNDYLYVITNFKAPNYRLVRINVNSLEIGMWDEIIPEKQYQTLKNVYFAGNRIIAKYLKDAGEALEAYNLDGTKSGDVELPIQGTILEFSGKLEDNKAYFSFCSYIIPPTNYVVDIETLKASVFFESKPNVDLSQYEQKQVFFEYDSVKIPITIVSKKNTKLNGNNPTLLYGYGGFNISITPRYKPEVLAWLQQGGIYAHANIRGGGEYGTKWHDAGRLFNKQNVFNDFIKAAEYLIENNYTSPDKLGIIGGSNGGLLIGAVINQRPELFSVAFPMVGVMDMLRFHRFTIGSAWISDYGCSSDSLQFLNLYSYSPLHNITKRKNYPATLVLTADHDDRVVPAHSYKYTAALQESNKGKNQTIIHIDTDAGHGYGKPLEKKINEAGLIYSFALYNMGYSELPFPID